MLITKNGKRETTEGIQKPNLKSIRMLGEKEHFKYLGILKADNIRQRLKKKK